MIVVEGDVRPIDFFLIVFNLFDFENCFDKELLQFFITVVTETFSDVPSKHSHAKLFEAVDFEIFETKNIQYSNELSGSLGVGFSSAS